MGAEKLESIHPYWWAKGEAGVSEWAGYRHNPRVIEYHSTCYLKATTDETAWCSAFVNWCVKKARARALELGMKQIPLETRSAMARSWLTYGFPTSSPVEGDIVILSRPNADGVNDGISGHVGFFVKRDLLWVYVWGGNQDNTVGLKKYARARVLGYRKVA